MRCSRSRLVKGPDTAFFGALLQGVLTGAQKGIPNCFVFQPVMGAKRGPLICLSNWASATAAPDVVQELVLEEICSPPIRGASGGWPPGYCSSSQSQAPHGLGQLGLQHQ